MNDKQLEKLSTLVSLKASMAQWGGARPFDRISGLVDKALDEFVEEIDPKPVEKPATIITPKGETKLPPEANQAASQQTVMDHNRKLDELPSSNQNREETRR